MNYYDQDGNPIGAERFAQLSHDPVYTFLKSTTIGERDIRTTWVGTDEMTDEQEVPYIYRTVIGGPNGETQVCWSKTRAEALTVHDCCALAIRQEVLS